MKALRDRYMGWRVMVRKRILKPSGKTGAHKNIKVLDSVFRIRISLNANPDPYPGFYLNTDPDPNPDPDSGFLIQDPDPMFFVQKLRNKYKSKIFNKFRFTCTFLDF